MTDLAQALIEQEEDVERCAYQDSRGYWSIGIGALVDRRFPGAGLCDEAIDAQFAHDSARARKDAAALPGFQRCNDVRQAVLISMCFQLGSLHDWPKFRAALAMGDYHLAALEGRDSLWWREQTRKRAERAMTMLESGQWVERE